MKFFQEIDILDFVSGEYNQRGGEIFPGDCNIENFDFVSGEYNQRGGGTLNFSKRLKFWTLYQENIIKEEVACEIFPGD